MSRMRIPLAVVAAAVIAVIAAPVGPAQAVDDHAVDRANAHSRVIDFWTPERIARAVPRDFVLDQGVLRPQAKPGGGGGGSTSSVLAASWTGGQLVARTTGKVFFAMGSSYYVCSGSVVSDTKTDRSLVLTAGHCTYDESSGAWATNWMFIPDYDSSPASLTTSGSFCASTTYGCWAADFLVASQEFTTAGGFNQTATVHDYAFAVVSTGGLSGTAQLDPTVGSQPVQFSAATSGATTYLFGYPAAGKFHGNDLVYSMGSLGYDSWNDNLTYRVGSTMTGGSSGGPWLQGFTTSTGTGTIMSVTSYGYSGTKALFGPKLNSETASMFTSAQGASLTSGNLTG